MLQDPTAPLARHGAGGECEQGAGLPRLQSVILGNGPALAVISGQSYRVGQLGQRLPAGGHRRRFRGAGKAGKRRTLTLFGSKDPDVSRYREGCHGPGLSSFIAGQVHE